MLTGISLEQAVDLIVRDEAPLGRETVPLSQAHGRALAEDLHALMDQPPFDRSPLDGYAMRAADTAGASQETPVPLAVAATVYAGDVASVAVEPGQAVRIMTGAMLPLGCDCVIRQEDTDRGFPVVQVRRALKPHDNYVDRGEDYRAGTRLLPAGTRLDAAAVGLLAGAGLTEAAVRRRPQVLVLSTGSEVCEPHIRPLPPGKIYGSNLALLTARLGELGIPANGGEQADDDPKAVALAMERLLYGCDALITTGGVSVGDRDIFHEALPLLGAEQIFWRVLVKPGTPAMFSRWRGKPILSLSGNPFAAAATFELLARPLLAALAGEPELIPIRATAVLEDGFPKVSPGRRFLRGKYQNGRVGLPQAHSSGVLSSLVGCNCLVDVPAGSGPLVRGQNVTILLL